MFNPTAFKKYFSILMILLVIINSHVSCSGYPKQPRENEYSILDDPEISKIRINDIGRFHEDAIMSFNKRHNLMSDKKLKPMEFFIIGAEAINEACDKNNIPVKISKEDFEKIMEVVATLGDRLNINFFERYNGIPEGFKDILTELGLRGDVADRYIGVLLKIKKSYDSNNDSNPFCKLYVHCNTDNPEIDDAFISLLSSSYCTWRNLYVSEYGDTLIDEWDAIVNKMAEYAADSLINLYLTLATGGMWLIPAIITVGSSIAFAQLTEGWSWSPSPYPHGR